VSPIIVVPKQFKFWLSVAVVVAVVPVRVEEQEVMSTTPLFLFRTVQPP
jgi:hypothetical protein